MALCRRRNPAFYNALIAGLQAANIPASLVESDAPSVEALLMEVASGAGCALVPESTMLRLSIPGVTFRRFVTERPIGCQMAAVALDAGLGPQLAAFVNALCEPRRERSIVAA